MTITRALPKDAGCYVEGGWGQYGIAHMVERAQEFGYSDAEVIDLADRHLATMHRGTDEGLSEDEYWTLVDASKDVENWLNDHVAPQDYAFGWHEGEFFLQPTQWWEGESY